MFTALLLLFAVPAGVLFFPPASERWRWTSLFLVPLPALGMLLAGQAWRIEPGAHPIAPAWADDLLSLLFYSTPLMAIPALVLVRRQWLVVAIFTLAEWAFAFLLTFGVGMQISGAYP